MQTINRSNCSTVSGLQFALQLENHGLIDHFVKSALSAMELNAHFQTIDEALMSQLFAVAQWYTSRRCFDRAEEIYLIVLEAQETVWGPESAASYETIDLIIELLKQEQEFRLETGQSDLSTFIDLSDTQTIMVAQKQ